jgi:Arc/MetJ-type ribon-helix-helix transcriptional regulator
MLPPFASPELNQLVHEELTAGGYASEEDVLLAGVKALRQLRAHERLRAEIQEGLAELERGEGIVLDGDESLGRFFDEIDAEVAQELSREAQAGE